MGETTTVSFDVTVTDNDVGSDTETVTVTITGTNDQPTLTASGTDASGSVTEKAEPNEGGDLTATGDITFADVDVTDQHDLTVGTTVKDENGVAIASPLGSLTLSSDATDNTDGTVGWTFTVADTAVEYLAAGESLTQVYTVTVDDENLGTVTQDITITIYGTNDSATLLVNTGNTDNANDTVYEAGLEDGSNAGVSSIQAEGAITLNDSDGLDDIEGIKITGAKDGISDVIFSDEDLEAIVLSDPSTYLTFETDNGEVTFNKFENGIISYIFLLTSPTTDVLNQIETNSFNVSVTDGTKNHLDELVYSAESTITFDIADDEGGTMSFTELEINREIFTFSGSYEFNSGADTSDLPLAITDLSITGLPTGFNFYPDEDTNGQWIAEDGDGNTFFVITVNNDGTYDFKLEAITPKTTQESVDLQGSINVVDAYNGYIESSQFGGAFAVEISGKNSTTDYGGATLSLSDGDFGVGGDTISEQQAEAVKFDIVQQAGHESASISVFNVILSSTGSFAPDNANKNTINFTITYDDGTEDIVSYDPEGGYPYIANADGTYTASLDINSIPDASGKTIDFIELEPGDNNLVLKVVGLALDYSETIDASDLNLAFNIVAEDGDGDTIYAQFDVDLVAGTSNNDILSGGVGNDFLSGAAGEDTISGNDGDDFLRGGLGNDELIGGLGDDLFVWTLADTDGGNDTITDFGNGSDALDISDLLTDGSDAAVIALVTAGSISIAEQVNGLNTDTVISITDSEGTSQNITLSDTTISDLTGTLYNGSSVETDVIQSLLNSGKLIAE